MNLDNYFIRRIEPLLESWRSVPYKSLVSACLGGSAPRRTSAALAVANANECNNGAGPPRRVLRKPLPWAKGEALKLTICMGQSTRLT